MTSNGQGPSPRPRDREPRRRARGADARRHERHLPWGVPLAIASPPAAWQRDDAGADFVLQAMQRAFQ